MTALVLLALAWAFLALSTAYVVGHGIRLADAGGPVRSGRGEARAATQKSLAVPVF